MEMYPKKVEKWKCLWYGCSKLYDSEREAVRCLYNHTKERAIELDFKDGFDLGYINHVYGLNLELSDKQKKITKDSCFTISYLQCCDHPAYRISNISHDGKFTVWGIGSWSGPYSSTVRLSCLSNPRPAEELFVDQRYYKK